MLITKEEFIEEKVNLFRQVLESILEENKDRDFSTVYEAEYRDSEFMKGLREEG